MVPGKRFPPYGKELAARLSHRNPPLLTFVFAGCDAWSRARHPRVRTGDCAPLVWDGADPKSVRWPVRGCHVVVELDVGPSVNQVRELVGRLLASGAVAVMTWWLRWSEDRPCIWLPDGTGRYLTAGELNEQVFRGRTDVA